MTASGGMTHSASHGSLAKVRNGTSSGTTIPRATTPGAVRVTQSMMGNYAEGTGGGVRTPISSRLASSGHRTGGSVRGSVNGPPSSWKSAMGATASVGTRARSRSGSFGSQDNDQV